MRVAKEERIRKETALEALESALKQRGLLRRPRRGTAGWKAIEQAICWWKGDDSWLNLPRDIQDIDLRTATAWRTYRQKGVGVMSKDVDQELLAVWTESLYYLIASDKEDDNSSNDSEISRCPPRKSNNDQQPTKRRRTKSRGSILVDDNSLDIVDEEEQHMIGYGGHLSMTSSSLSSSCGVIGQTVLHTPPFDIEMHTDPHIDYITPDGEFICQHPPPPPLYPQTTPPSPPITSSSASIPIGASSSYSYDTYQRADSDGFSVSPSTSLLNEGFLSTSPAKPFVGSYRGSRKTVKHCHHDDELISTNDEGTEFDIICGSIAGQHRHDEDDSGGGGEDYLGGGGERHHSKDSSTSSDMDKLISEDMANLKLLNEDDASKYAMEFTTTGLLEVGNDFLQCSGLIEFQSEFTNDLAQTLF